MSNSQNTGTYEFSPTPCGSEKRYSACERSHSITIDKAGTKSQMLGTAIISPGYNNPGVCTLLDWRDLLCQIYELYGIPIIPYLAFIVGRCWCFVRYADETARLVRALHSENGMTGNIYRVRRIAILPQLGPVEEQVSSRP